MQKVVAHSILSFAPTFSNFSSELFASLRSAITSIILPAGKQA